MRQIFGTLQVALGMELPASLRVKSLPWLVSIYAIVAMFATPAATAQKPQTLVATSQRVYGSAEWELTASLKRPERQEQGSQESITAAPPRPLAPARAGANQPQVSYEDGKLTIVAENSELSDVLSAVRAQTGADIELPPGASSQRIWARLGPGPARKVLAILLGGTDLDYVIQASEIDPQGIQSVLLTLRAKTADIRTGGPGALAGQPPQSANRRLPPRSNPSPEEAQGPENAASPEPAASPEVVPAGSQPASAELQPLPQTTGSTTNNSSSMAEQMIEKLQNMYEQRKQMMQPTPKPPPPN
jgi:hypothetical protein